MLMLLIVLTLFAGQPDADDEAPVAAGSQAPPPVPEAVSPSPPKPTRIYGFGGRITRKPMTEAEAREAANRAAIARAEQAGRDANPPPGGWRDDSNKMRCRQTGSGFACGTSDKAIDEQEKALKARMDALDRPD